MSKRNFRKKVESSSEDEAEGLQHSQRIQSHDEQTQKPQRNIKTSSLSSISDDKDEGDDKELKVNSSSKKKAAVLSFGDDDDDSGVLDLKKSKDSKAFKKRMRQAPGAAQVVAAAATASEPVGIGSSGLYSAESLAELKRQQQFSTTSASKALADGDITSAAPDMELAGDDAVLVSGDGLKNEPTESSTAMDTDQDGAPTRRVTFADGDEFTSERHGRKESYGNYAIDDDDDEAQEAAQDWEIEVLRRAGQTLRSNRPSATTMNNLNLQELTISDTRESISQAIRSLKNSTTEGQSKAQGLEKAFIDAENEEKRLKAVVETAVDELAALKVCAFLHIRLHTLIISTFGRVFGSIVLM